MSNINTRYISSEFIDKAGADDALAKFESASSDLVKSKFTQVFSDRPNITLKFFDFLKEKQKDEVLKKLTYIGPCGRHTINRAFQNVE